MTTRIPLRSSILIGILLTSTATLSYLLFTYTSRHKQQLSTLSEDHSRALAVLNEKIELLESEAEAARTTSSELSESLSDAQKRYENLKEENEEYEEQVEDLTKLTTIDPELLKKYSKVYFLNENYEPSGLEPISEDFLLTKNKELLFHEDAEQFLTRLMDDAREDGIDIAIASAYRSFGTQAALKSKYVTTYGAGSANAFSADQGYSEHQLGTAIDFVSTEQASLTTSFDTTDTFAWLTEHAHKYGFILSYPKGNTYYQYEPWHWRFVGEDLARKLKREDLNFYDIDQRVIDDYLIRIFD